MQERQQELINRTVEQLEAEVARTAAREGATALDVEDVAAQKQVLEARKLLLQRLKQVRAKGRVVIRLAELDKLKGSESDLMVEHRITSYNVCYTKLLRLFQWLDRYVAPRQMGRLTGAVTHSDSRFTPGNNEGLPVPDGWAGYA